MIRSGHPAFMRLEMAFFEQPGIPGGGTPPEDPDPGTDPGSSQGPGDSSGNIATVDVEPGGFVTEAAIKDGVTIHHGNLIALDSNNRLLLADRTTGPVRAQGVAVFVSDYSGLPPRVGNSDGTVRCSMYNKCKVRLQNLTVGARVYLDVGGKYIQSPTLSNADVAQVVGIAKTSRTAVIDIPTPGVTKNQTAANTTAVLG